MHRDQERGRRAFAFCSELDTARVDDLVSFARELPSLVQRSGLLAAWTFCLAKKTREHGDILRALQSHLGGSGLLSAELAAGEPKDVLGHWLGSETGHAVGGLELRRLTAESLEFAGWLKRAAEALSSGKDREDLAAAAGGGAP